jgi:hypothetical protein
MINDQTNFFCPFFLPTDRKARHISAFEMLKLDLRNVLIKNC